VCILVGSLGFSGQWPIWSLKARIRDVLAMKVSIQYSGYWMSCNWLLPAAVKERKLVVCKFVAALCTGWLANSVFLSTLVCILVGGLDEKSHRMGLLWTMA